MGNGRFTTVNQVDARSCPERSAIAGLPRRCHFPPSLSSASGRRCELESDRFPTEVNGLSPARSPELVELSDGDHLELRVEPVAKELADERTDARLQRLDPGPDAEGAAEARITVDIENQGDLEATVHWHGLRLENRFDGTHETQPPIEVGERFTVEVTFPDPGAYWYHPHIRQDYGQEMGLYGNVLVEPADPDYWPPVNREILLTLDDVLLDEDGAVGPFSRAETTHSAMGRFGDLLLIGGETDYRCPRSRERWYASTSPTRPTRGSSRSPCRAPG